MRRPRSGLGMALAIVLAIALAPALAVALATPDSAEARWKQARGLADRGRFDDALAAVRTGLKEQPDDTGLLWLEAGILGEAGRHRDAVARYEALMTRHPELARDLRRDLAAQRLWADDPAGALRDIDLSLEESPPDREARRLRAIALARLDRHREALAAFERLLAESPEDAEAALDRARVLGWMGRHAEARAAYEQHLRRHPGDNQARIALAQNVNWSGEHRRAATLYETLRRGGNADPEITKGLAYAEYWAGRADRAHAALERYLAERPADPEGLSLARMLAREGGTHVTIGFQRSDDTDALRVQTTTLELEHPLDARTALMLRWRRDEARDAGGTRDPRWISAGLERRLSNLWSGQLVTGYVKPAPGADALAVGEANVALRPDDRWRFDAGWSRQPVLTRESLALRIMVGTLTTGFDWRAGRRVTIHGDQRLRAYNDDNRSALRTVSVRAVLQSSRRSELGVNLGLSHLTTDQDLDHGYYDPERYVEAGPGGDLTLRPREGWRLRLGGQIGRLREQDSPQQPFYNVAASAAVPLGEVLVLHAEGSRSDSNLNSDSGYRQKRWAAWLTAGL